jgi:hypothetical protein
MKRYFEKTDLHRSYFEDLFAPLPELYTPFEPKRKKAFEDLVGCALSSGFSGDAVAFVRLLSKEGVRVLGGIDDLRPSQSYTLAVRRVVRGFALCDTKIDEEGLLRRFYGVSGPSTKSGASFAER